VSDPSRIDILIRYHQNGSKKLNAWAVMYFTHGLFLTCTSKISLYLQVMHSNIYKMYSNFHQNQPLASATKQPSLSYSTWRASITSVTSVHWGVWLTVTILGFPRADDVQWRSHELSKGASWPGIKIVEWDLALKSQAERGKDAMGGKAGGCPEAKQSCLVPSRLQPMARWKAEMLSRCLLN
jgi:hypothetical protein